MEIWKALIILIWLLSLSHSFFYHLPVKSVLEGVCVCVCVCVRVSEYLETNTANAIYIFVVFSPFSFILLSVI